MALISIVSGGAAATRKVQLGNETDHEIGGGNRRAPILSKSTSAVICRKVMDQRLGEYGDFMQYKQTI